VGWDDPDCHHLTDARLLLASRTSTRLQPRPALVRVTTIALDTRRVRSRASVGEGGPGMGGTAMSGSSRGFADMALTTLKSSTRPSERMVIERQEFAAFYAATFRSLCAQLYVHTGDLAEAQDVVQEAFCRALPRWSRLAEYDDPAGWVRKVAWNLATSRWRRVRKLGDITRRHRDEPHPSPTPDRVVLQGALARLPARQRQAIVLHYLADASVAEIGHSRHGCGWVRSMCRPRVRVREVAGG